MMKKVFFILSTLFLLMACSNLEQAIDEKATVDGQDIKVNIVIKQANITADTKATVKTAFADGDKVFLLFEDVAAPKYLELAYNSGSWTPSAKNGLDSGDLPASGEMTALYLPYGKDFTVAADGTSFLFQKDGENYSGHFYYKENVSYTFESNTVTAGSVTLVAAAPASGDLLVHFDVSGYTTGHSYNMYQDYMKPMSLTSIAADGTVSTTTGSMGDAIRGYEDASFLSFSGVLDATVNGNEVDYWFSIRDTETGKLYYRDAGTKSIDANKYIGLGSFSEKWSVATQGAFSVSDTKTITFARSNLAYFGASNHVHPWRLMEYPWSIIESGPDNSPIILGENEDFSLFAWATSGYADPTRPDWDWTPWKTDNSGSKYGPAIGSGEWTSDSDQWDWAIYNDIYEFGGNTPLSGWRTPTADEWINIFARSDTYIFANATVNSVAGMMLFPDGFTLPDGVAAIVNINGYMSFTANVFSLSQWDRLEAAGVVFLPAAGCSSRGTSQFTQVGTMGYYQSSTAYNSSQAHQMRFSAANGQPANHGYRQSGFSVRLVRDLN